MNFAKLFNKLPHCSYSCSVKGNCDCSFEAFAIRLPSMFTLLGSTVMGNALFDCVVKCSFGRNH